MRATYSNPILVMLRAAIVVLLALATPAWANSAPQKCDVNSDGIIDLTDINLIVAARNRPASGPNDPRDADSNGIINAIDLRTCQQRCTYARCDRPPTAMAGPAQSVFVTDTVHLNGSGSTDPDGDPLTYHWTLSVPGGSSATLSSTTAVAPTFVVDKPGTYTAQLIVNDSIATSAPSSALISTINSPPVANPKASCAALPNTDCSVPIGSAVGLNGSASTDVDGNPLTYAWLFKSMPAGSSASISTPAAVSVGFTTDAPGDFVVQLIVNDGTVDSLPKTIKVTSTNVKPTAVPTANPMSIPSVPSLVRLDGSGAVDPEHQTLTYAWSILNKPSGSGASLSSLTAVNPQFTADRVGTYVVQLIVNDGFLSSDPVTVSPSTSNQPPVAVAGGPGTARVGTDVQVLGTGSYDPEGATLGFFWSLIHKPLGSGSDFTSAAANHANPTFVPDLPGDYVAQLIVNDSALNSTPATTQITAVEAELSVAKSHSGNFTRGQTGATYSITVTNAAGAASTTGPVTVIDTLPAAGLTATGMSGTGWTCTLATLTCTRSDPLAAGNSYPVITLTVNVAASAPSSVTNSVAVSGGGSPAANGSDVTSVLPTADLTIAKTHSGNFTQGQTGATYTLTVSNVGAGTSSGTVTVTDTLPAAGLTATAISGTGWTCTLTTLTCTRSDALASSASYPAITLTVNVVTNAAASLTNSATVSGGSDSNNSNNSASDLTTINPMASSLSIAKTHSGNFALTQVGAHYSIVVSNASGASATSGTVTVTDTLPTGLTATAMSGTGWTCTLATLTCTRSDTLVPGNSYPTITLTVNVASDAPANVTNTASVSGGNSATPPAANDPTVIASLGNLSLVPNPLNVETFDSAQMTLGINAAPPGDLTVNLLSGHASLASAPATATIPGSSTSTTFTVTTGASKGSASMTASAPGTVSGSATVNVVNRGASLVLASQFVAPSEAVTARITLSRPAPTGGVTFNVASTQTGFATVSTPTVFIAAGATQGNFTVTGVAPGAGTITASVAGFEPQAAGFTVTSNLVRFQRPASVCIPQRQCQFFVGQDLQDLNWVYLDTAAPKGGLQVQVSSDNANVLLSTSATAAGASSVTLTVPAGQTQAGPFYIQSLANSGTAMLSLAVVTSPNPGYATEAPLTVTMVPSGYVLVCISGGGSCSQNNPNHSLSTSTQAAPTAMSLSAYALDPTRSETNYPFRQDIRGGLTRSIPLTLTNGALGAFTSFDTQTPITAVTISSNEGSGIFYFDPSNAGSGGSGTIGYMPPAGAGTPVRDSQPWWQTIAVTVSAAPVTFSSTYNYCYFENCQLMVGQDLQVLSAVNLGEPAPAGGLTVRVSSDNANVLLSVDPSAQGADHVDLTIGAGGMQSSSPFYVQSLTNTGTATLTISILTTPNPGFVGSTQTVTMVPSAYMLNCISGGGSCSFYGQNYSLSTSTQAAPMLMWVVAVGLDLTRSDDNIGGGGSIRGGFTQSIPLTLTNGALGAFTSYETQTPITAVTIPSGWNGQYFYFDPDNNGTGGSGTIGFTPPAGTGTPLLNSLPHSQTIPVTVSATPVTFSSTYNNCYYDEDCQLLVGQDLQQGSAVNLGGPAPAGGLTVRVSSDNAGVLLSADPGAQGTDHVDLTIGAGGMESSQFYVQSLVNSGTAMLSLAVVTSPNPGYATEAQLTVKMVPSGYVLSCAYNGSLCSSNKWNDSLSTSTQAAPTAMSLSAYALDPTASDYTNFRGNQRIRGGLTRSIPLTLTNGALGAFTSFDTQTPITAVTIASNENFGIFYLDPRNAGSSGIGTIGYTPPAGAGTPVTNGLPVGQTIPLSVTQTPHMFSTVFNYNNEFAVGKDLQTYNYIKLTGPAPGYLTVRLTSDNANVLLSTDGSVQGTDHVDLPIFEGSTQSSGFYIQSLANTGTATLTVIDANPGVPGTSMTVTMVPSGYGLVPQQCTTSVGCGFANNVYMLTTSAGAGNLAMAIATMALDPLRTDYNQIGYQAIRGGHSQVISLTLDNPTIGEYREWPGASNAVTMVTIGNQGEYFYFSPLAAGTGTMSYSRPPGAGVPRNNSADYLQTIYMTVQ